MLEQMQSWPVIRPILRLFSSSKFITLLLAALVADFGLDLSDNTQALIYAVAASIYGLTTAIEDGASKRGL